MQVVSYDFGGPHNDHCQCVMVGEWFCEENVCIRNDSVLIIIKYYVIGELFKAINSVLTTIGLIALVGTLGVSITFLDV